MSETTQTTASATTPSATNPFAAWFGAGNPFLAAMGGDAWRKGMADHLARVQAVTDEVARVEAQGFAHTRTMIDESAKLAQETVSYASQLSAEWRKLMFEAARKSLDLVNPAAR